MKRLPVYRVELVRDRSIPYEPTSVSSPMDIAPLVVDLVTKDREHLIVFYLNARHHVVGMETISIGTLTASLAHPREIFKGAIVKGAAGIIIAHNHPSGDPSPSDEDARLTRRLADAGRILGIDLLDHLIVAESGSFSYKTSGQL